MNKIFWMKLPYRIITILFIVFILSVIIVNTATGEFFPLIATVVFILYCIIGRIYEAAIEKEEKDKELTKKEDVEL